METKIKLYPTDYWKYETRAYLNAYFHICDKEEGKTFEGWAEIRIYPIIRNKIVILMRTVDVWLNMKYKEINLVLNQLNIVKTKGSLLLVRI